MWEKKEEGINKKKIMSIYREKTWLFKNFPSVFVVLTLPETNGKILNNNSLSSKCIT